MSEVQVHHASKSGASFVVSHLVMLNVNWGWVVIGRKTVKGRVGKTFPRGCPVIISEHTHYRDSFLQSGSVLRGA